MRPIVLVNVSAGTAAELVGGEDLPARIARGFAEVGLAADVHPFEPKRLNEALDTAQAATRPVIMAGGDGSVSAAVQRLAGTGTPLGVLPLGTYNLLGNDLGMSTDLDEAIRQFATVDERKIDLGRMGRRKFHTLSGLGFFSRVARQRAQIRRSLPGAKVVGAAVAAIRSLMRGGNLDIDIDDGTRKETFRTPAVLITNNLLGADTWRRRRLDAGVFEINVVRGDVPFPLLRGGFAALMGSWRESADIATWTAPRMTLTFRRPRVFLSLDGEIIRPRTPLHYEIMPRALTVLAPPPVAETAPDDRTAEAIAPS
jgi:diacylglycerol kinase family enzyme